MVAAKAKGKGDKSAFIAGVLKKNPTANPVAVNKAWTESGREGSVSVTLVQKIRSDMGLSGNIRPLPRGSQGESHGAAGVHNAPEAQSPGNGSRKKEGETAFPSNGFVAHATAGKSSRQSDPDRDRLLTEAEGDIDRLIFKLMIIGGLEDIEDALRAVRRRVVRSHDA